jgi:ribosomal protein S18 acetylase RimI-like enzyme
LVHFFVMARVFRGEVLLGISSDSHEGLIGTALVSRPGGAHVPSEFLRLRDEVWTELGSDARDRYGAFSAACAPFQIEAPHLHLNMIGVRNVAQGTGVGRRLIDSVHELSRTDPRSVGVSLTTENPANVALYRHCGYEVVGEALVAPELTTWGFFRPD